MANILLIEPSYHCKYPPLGLMKLAYYHKEIRKDDIVWFSKGKLSSIVSDKVKNQLHESKYYKNKYGDNLNEYIRSVEEVILHERWDRIYVSTLFTYEWSITLETIEYAKNLAGDLSKVYTGGILATLMSDELERQTGIKPIRGQLVNSNLIGYNDGVNIDILTPDYSILDNTEYVYPSDNAYFAYATRGCGMNCEFCAVKTLEPQYIPYISIKDQINKVKTIYGEKKDLLLMDNNVLKSTRFNDIIDEIIELGFEYGATFCNPRTGKMNNRYVDFNQGLDSLLFNEKKVSLLKKIALRPARIAFDHIAEKDDYEKALDIAVKHDITHLSNYLLYNADAFDCKGTMHEADKPEDLYNRLRINVDYQERINKIRRTDNKERIHIFSFPMRYIPLNAKERGYIGPNWNAKYLRAIQRILVPTQGKGVSSKSFFEAAFGKDEKEYMMVLLMPEEYIASRGKPEKIVGLTEKERYKKVQEFRDWEDLRKTWENAYRKLSEEQKNAFHKRVFNNDYTTSAYIDIPDVQIRKLFIHYFSEFRIITVLEDLEIMVEDELKNELISYVANECRIILRNLAKYIVRFKLNSTQNNSFFRFFKQDAINELINIWVDDNYDNNRVIELLDLDSSGYGNPYYLLLIKWCDRLGLLAPIEIEDLVSALKENNRPRIENILNDKYDMVFATLKRKYQSVIDINELDSILDEARNELSYQMSLFEL